MKDAWKIAFAVLCGVVFGLLSGGGILLITRQPPGQPVALLSPPVPAPIVVYVAGAVRQPGVYTLPAGSRVQDAIQAAGGFTEQANPTGLNLAALLQDGLRVQAPAQPPTPAAPEAAALAPAGTDAPAASAASNTATAPKPPTLDPQHPININTASQQELESLPRIGPVTAQKIIAYREANGPFKTIEEIMNVSGIGPKTFEQIRAYITVDIYP